MTRGQSSRDSNVLAGGLLIILFCCGGAAVANMEVWQFVASAFLVMVLGTALLAFLYGVLVLFAYTFRRARGDTRSFLQIVQEEYRSNEILCSYRLLFVLTKDYFGEIAAYSRAVGTIKGAIRLLAGRFRLPGRVKPPSDNESERGPL